MKRADGQQIRRLLCELQDSIRVAIDRARTAGAGDTFSQVAGRTVADTIYQVDKVSEAAIVAWFTEHWPREWPVQVVMEGIEDDAPVTFPAQTPVAATVFKCILDPIDGTRNIMYDKRSAWSLAAVAPQQGAATRLSDILVAAMTELPTTKQWRADQLSCVNGTGIVAEAINLQTGTRAPLLVRPSPATDFRHGFASFSRFFPEGKSLLAKVEEDLWDELYGLGRSASPLVFDDQYISTGGQIYELLIGHDRMIGDLRPLALKKLGYDNALVCHPYDICTAMILTEAGGVVETPDGRPLDAPLDTTSAVAWMGYANPTLAGTVRPILQRLLAKHFAP